MYNLEINGKTYTLALRTSDCVALETALGYNPLQMLMDIEEDKLPKFKDMMLTFKAMLQRYEHGFDMAKTCDLFDDYLADGHQMFDIIPVFVDVMKDCGLIQEPGEDEIKNQ